MMKISVLLKGLLFFSMFSIGAVVWFYAATPEMVMRNAVPIIWGIDARLIAATITIIGLGGVLAIVAKPPNQ